MRGGAKQSSAVQWCGAMGQYKREVIVWYRNAVQKFMNALKQKSTIGRLLTHKHLAHCQTIVKCRLAEQCKAS